MPITLSGLVHYPIKSCSGIHVTRSRVEAIGLESDRRMMLVTPEGKFLTQREHHKLALVKPVLSGQTLSLSAPGMEEISLAIMQEGVVNLVSIWKSSGVEAIDQGDLAARWFSEWLNASVRLVHLAKGYRRKVSQEYAVTPNDHTGFADGYPILIATEASLADLNARMEQSIPMDRFRPNLILAGSTAFEEDEWNRIFIGDIELAVVKPCARCVITTIDKQTLEVSREPLKTLSTFRRKPRGVMFGQNAIPLVDGWLEVGMPVQISMK